MLTDRSYLHMWAPASLEGAPEKFVRPFTIAKPFFLSSDYSSCMTSKETSNKRRKTIATMSYGKRLIPVLIDEAARDTPQRVYASIPRSSKDLSEGFEDITYARFANAINRAAAWLDAALGGRGSTAIFAYAGPKDLRYTILTVAAVRSGREVSGRRAMA